MIFPSKAPTWQRDQGSNWAIFANLGEPKDSAGLSPTAPANSRAGLLIQPHGAVLTQTQQEKGIKEIKSFGVIVGCLFCQVSVLNQGLTSAEASSR